MNVGGRLAEIESMQVLFGKMARQAFECADFIVHYSETKSACESNPVLVIITGLTQFFFSFLQGRGWPGTSPQKPVSRFRVTVKFLMLSCSNFVIARFAIPL
jgi:hypothetical protein